MSFAIPIAARAEAILAMPVVAGHQDIPVISAEAVQAVNEALDREETHYTDRPGILPLRDKAADYLNGRFATEFKGKSDLVITCGLTEACFVTIQQLCKPDDKIFSLSEGGTIAGAAVLRGASMTDAVVEASLIHVTSTKGESAIREVLEQAADGAFILFEVDDAASGFHPASISNYAERTITAGGILEDGMLSGARVGYLASPAKAAPGLRDFKQALTICTTNLSQWAALAAWQTK